MPLSDMLANLFSGATDINQLAQAIDPGPIQASLASSQLDPNTGFDADYGSYSKMLMPSDSDSKAPKKPSFLDPKALRELGQMLKTTPMAPHFAPAAAPRQPVPAKIEIPDISTLIKLNSAPAPSAAAAPSLAALLNGR